jgi:hypothetical protein
MIASPIEPLLNLLMQTDLSSALSLRYSILNLMATPRIPPKG